jgi:hypothetical protein
MTALSCTFPNPKKAPPEIGDPDDCCGLLSMWQVLEALDCHVDPATILKHSRYRPGFGIDTIGLALGFHDLGFYTEFRSEGVTSGDKAHLLEAKSKNMPILPPADIKTLLALPAYLVVAYNTSDGMGHVSPITSLTENNVLIAVEDIPIQAIGTLEARRRHSLMETISIYPLSIAQQFPHKSSSH